MAIYPKIEMRRAKRRNGAAYQHRRRRSLTGGQHSVIAHGRRMEYQRSRSMFLTHGIARLTAKSWSDRALLPRKRARSAHAQLFAHRLRSPTWSHVCAGPLSSYIFFKILGASRRPPGGGTGQLEFHSEGWRGPVPATRPGPGSGTRCHGASLCAGPPGPGRAGKGDPPGPSCPTEGTRSPMNHGSLLRNLYPIESLDLSLQVSFVLLFSLVRSLRQIPLMRKTRRTRLHQKLCFCSQYLVVPTGATCS